MSYRGIRHSAMIHGMNGMNLQDTAVPESFHSTRCRQSTHGKYKQYVRRKAVEYAERTERREVERAKMLHEADALRVEAARLARWSVEDAKLLIRKERSMRAKALGTIRSAATRTYAYVPHPYTPPSPPQPDPQVAALAEELKGAERNFMDGISYRINPVDTLKMITASSIFGEPQYYRDGGNTHAKLLDAAYRPDRLAAHIVLDAMDPFEGMTTSQVMEKAIDEALAADFEATLNWALELRTQYNMRLNPQVIMVRAAAHPGREVFTKAQPGAFGEIARRVMQRGDDVTFQIGYWLAKKGSKRGIPAILKRAWADRIGAMDAYTMAKYGNAGIGLVDAVRICHAKGELVDELMRNGKVVMPEGENTWERLRASGMKWADIFREIRMPHMALLRNLRGIFSEVQDEQVRTDALELLKKGVRKGRQFPFRYLSAWKAVEAEGRPWSRQVQQALEECMDISCENLPRLPGRCAFLSDNSGSAWGTCTSEWGSMQVAEIGNLSSVIGAMCADEGVAFPFGDRLSSIPIHKDEGVLAQAKRVSDVGSNCGMATENGIWLFFRDAIMQKQVWDSIFIYSDMQAGHGDLYGIRSEDYAALGCCCNGRYVDVNRLVELYRQHVNPKVNVYCIQTAGYTNALVPEYGYRTAILYGWTGKELIFADALRRTWDALEARQESDS